MNYEEFELEALGKVYNYIKLYLDNGNIKTFLADESNPEYVEFLLKLGNE